MYFFLRPLQPWMGENEPPGMGLRRVTEKMYEVLSPVHFIT